MCSWILACVCLLSATGPCPVLPVRYSEISLQGDAVGVIRSLHHFLCVKETELSEPHDSKHLLQSLSHSCDFLQGSMAQAYSAGQWKRNCGFYPTSQVQPFCAAGRCLSPSPRPQARPQHLQEVMTHLAGVTSASLWMWDEVLQCSLCEQAWLDKQPMVLLLS